MTRFRDFILFGILFIKPCFAELSHLDLKGVDDLLKPEYRSSFSIANGLMVLKTNTLANLRFFGNFGKENKAYPCHAQIRGERRAEDCPQGPIEAVIQHLFPSPDGTNLVANQAAVDDPFNVKNFSNETLGKLLGAIADLSPDKLRDLSLEKNKGKKEELISDLTGILFGFKKSDELRNLRGNLEAVMSQKECEDIQEDEIGVLDKQIKKISNQLKQIEGRFKKDVKGSKAEQLRTFSKMLIEALIEENKEKSSYPKDLVKQTLLAYVWMKSESRKDILDFFKGASSLLQESHRNWVTDKNHPQRADWLKDQYQNKDYFDWKGEFKNNLPTEVQIDHLARSPQHAAFSSYSYEAVEAFLPPLSDYNLAAHESLLHAPTKRKEGPYKGQGLYPNCGEQTINSFFDIITYNQKDSVYDPRYLEDIEKDNKLDLNRLIRFYQVNSSPADVHKDLRKDQFSELVSNLNSQKSHKIRYLKPTGNEVCELDAGMQNVFSVLEALLWDHGKGGLGQLTTHQEKFDRLCKLFSRDNFKLDWRLKESKNKQLGNNDFGEIEFTKNGEPLFEWSFKKGHFSLKSLVNDPANWRTQIGEKIAKKVQEEGGNPSLINWYIGSQNTDAILKQLTDPRLESKNSNSVFPQIIYSAPLRLEAGKISAIRQIAAYKREDFYPLIEKLVKDMPLNDAYTQSLLFNTLTPLKENKNLSKGLDAVLEKTKRAILKKPLRGLEIAVENNHLSVVKLLIEAKKSLATPDHRGSTPLHLAARNGFSEIVQALIDAKVPVDPENNEKSTPLHKAAEAGHLEIVQALIKAQAKMTTKDQGGATPVTLAVRGGHAEILKAFLEAKVDVHMKGPNGSTLLHDAVFNRNGSETLQVLIDAHAEINATDLNGATPLHRAAFWGSVQSVQALLRAKALTSLTDQEGNTPLHVAASAGFPETIKALIEAKAKINLVNQHGTTPLHEAVKHGKIEAAKVLIQARADTDVADQKGFTPLHDAAKYGLTDLVRLLIDASARINRVDQDGSTALHLAAKNGHTDTVEALIKFRAEINSKNKAGLTPLGEAARAGNVSTAKILAKHLSLDQLDEELTKEYPKSILDVLKKTLDEKEKSN